MLFDKPRERQHDTYGSAALIGENLHYFFGEPLVFESLIG